MTHSAEKVDSPGTLQSGGPYYSSSENTMDSALQAANRESAESFFSLAKAKIADGNAERAVELLKKAMRMNDAESKYGELLNEIATSETTDDDRWTVKGGRLANESGIDADDERGETEENTIYSESSSCEANRTTSTEEGSSRCRPPPAAGLRVGGARISRTIAAGRRGRRPDVDGEVTAPMTSTGGGGEYKGRKRECGKSRSRGRKRAVGDDDDVDDGNGRGEDLKEKLLRTGIYILAFVWTGLALLAKVIWSVICVVKEWTFHYGSLAFAYVRVKTVFVWRKHAQPRLRRAWITIKTSMLTKLGREPEASYNNSNNTSTNNKTNDGTPNYTIELPTTSHEAVERLLTCRDKDLYSILGVARDASEEEIKRHYRKQAVMVHPDKNESSGTEEAFKILSQAFETLKDPEKRREYDSKSFESEALRTKFEEFFEDMKKKMEEAKNWLQCQNCNGSHRRYRTDRPLYAARYCSACNGRRHPVTEGDLWCETAMLGFKVFFYACMDRAVWDVSEWAGCQNLVSRVPPNHHLIVMRLATTRDTSSSSPPPPPPPPSQPFFGRPPRPPRRPNSSWRNPGPDEFFNRFFQDYEQGFGPDSRPQQRHRSHKKKKRKT